jgi:amidohydrolase
MNDVVNRIGTAVNDGSAEMIELLETISANPEIAGEEVNTAAAICDVLARNGFDVRPDFEGYRSAFVAEYTTGPGPKIVFLAKYDALPGFDRGKDAHGCGHNWVGTLSVAAAVAVSKLAHEFHGTVAVVGAPTETFFGQAVSVRDSDYFADAAAVFHSHLNDRNLLYSFPLPINTLELAFHGKASQAFSYPDRGVNAVDAAVDTMAALRELKKQAREFDRVNYIVHYGGRSTESIPDSCIVRVAVGGATQQRTEELTGHIATLAERCADGHGASVTATVVNRFPTLVNDVALHSLVARCFGEVGEPYDVLPQTLGRTALDVASVSALAPMLYMFFGVPDWISHQPTLSRVEASHAPAAVDRLHTATRIFARAGLTILTDQRVREQIAADHARELAMLRDGTAFGTARFATVQTDIENGSPAGTAS